MTTKITITCDGSEGVLVDHIMTSERGCYNLLKKGDKAEFYVHANGGDITLHIMERGGKTSE